VLRVRPADAVTAGAAGLTSDPEPPAKTSDILRTVRMQEWSDCEAWPATWSSAGQVYVLYYGLKLLGSPV
jgi:hypothetical protein